MGRRTRRREPQPAPVPARRRWPAAVFVFALAFCARALASFSLRDVPLWRTPALDSLEYLTWARRILESGFYWPAYPEHAPGYPFLLAALLFLFNNSTTMVHIAHAAIGGVNAVLTARLAGVWFTRAAFVPAGVLYAVCAPLVLWEASLLAEGPFLFFALSAMNLMRSPLQPTLRGALTGLALGCAAIVRPTALVLVPLAIFTIVRRRDGTRTNAVAAAGVLLLGLAVPVAPVVFQNYRTSATLAIQGYGGFNFYVGNHPQRDGLASARPGGEWDWIEGAAGRAGRSEPRDADAFYVREVLAAIRAEPSRYLRLLAGKAWWLIQAEEIRDTHSFHFFAAESWLLRVLPGFGFVLALAAAGAVACIRRRHRCWPAVAFIVAMGATCVFLIVGSRYRVPMLPGLLAFAGAGVAWTLDEARARNTKAIAAAVLAVIVVGAVAVTRQHPPSHDLAEEWSLNGFALRVEGNGAAAEGAYRTALHLNDASSFAWTGLGTLKLSQGDAVLAIDHLQTAVRCNDRNAQAWQTLGDAYQQTGRTDAAIDAYARSLAIAPERMAPAEALGLALVRNREYQRALPLLTKVAARSADTARVETALAIATLSLGDFETSVRHARRATELTPATSGAWTLLARAAMGAGRTDEAASALETARRRGGDPVVVTAGRLHLMLLRGDRGGVDQAFRELQASNPEVAKAVAAEMRSWSAGR